MTFLNGVTFRRGDVIGDSNELNMLRVQIRETIMLHFEKERLLRFDELTRFIFSHSALREEPISMCPRFAHCTTLISPQPNVRRWGADFVSVWTGTVCTWTKICWERTCMR